MQPLRETNGRDYGFDNVRAVLIICVVFAHLLEIGSPFSCGEAIYKTMYSFHMPVFLFISGWFAKRDLRKLVFGLLVPYLLFQTAYICFDRWLYGTDTPLQFHMPYWLLWFLLALVFYNLLLPIYDASTPKKRLAIWLAVFVLSVAIGYVPFIGYGLTLSRFFVFQPWFLLGFYARKTDFRKPPWWVYGLIALTLGVCLVFLCWSSISANMLYGSYSYAKLGYHAGIRLFLAGIALLWIFLFFAGRTILSKRIPLVTVLGQNTLPVFLLHGFAVRAIGHCWPQILETPLGFFGVTVLILVLAGNPFTAMLFRQIWPETWIKKWARCYNTAAK